MRRAAIHIGLLIAAPACAGAGGAGQTSSGGASAGDANTPAAGATPATSTVPANAPSTGSAGSSALVATLDGAALKSATYGLNAWNGLYFYSFDFCSWGQAHAGNTCPNTAGEVMVALPYVGTPGQTTFTASSLSGDLTIAEAEPYVVITAGCAQTLYRVSNGSMTVSSITGLASERTFVGTADITFSGGQPSKTLTVRGPFTAVTTCSGTAPAPSEAACTLPPLVGNFGLTLRAY